MFESLALHTCNLGDEVRVGTNPFTGEKVEFPIDKGLSDDEVAALKGLLSEYNASRSDADYSHQIAIGDTDVSVSAGPLDAATPCRGIGITIEGPVTVEVLRLIRRIALEANVTVGSAVDPDVVAVIGEAKSDTVAERWPDAPLLENEQQFIEWVETALEMEVVR